MKILIVCDHFFPEEFIINDLAQEWEKNGHEIAVLTQNPAYPKGKIFNGYKNRLFQVTYWNTIKIFRVFTVQEFQRSTTRKILNYLSFPILGSIQAIFISRKFDRIFIYQVGPLTQAIPAILAHKIFNRKVSIWTGDIWPDTVYAYGFRKTRVLSFFLDKLVKAIYKNCNPIFIPSRGFQKVINKYLPEQKLIFAPNWHVSRNGNKHADTLEEFELSNRINFTFAGNIGKVQNLRNVVLGFEKALQSTPGITLNIVGDGSFLEELQRIVLEKNISNVIFWGRQPFDEMSKYYHASDFLIISLDPDPVYDLYIPSKFQAYLQCGKPILCIMGGEVAELVRKNEIGFVAEPDNLEDIAEKFTLCMKLSKLQLSAIQSNSRSLLYTDFNREIVIRTMTEEMMK